MMSLIRLLGMNGVMERMVVLNFILVILMKLSMLKK